MAAESTALETLTVTARRLPVADAGQSVVRLSPESAPLGRLDRVLGRVPGVGLFRRADSYSAHPTTQGLTMRGIGANAAGRVLVTLDGMPLNDPFGGWIYWSALAPETLAEATVRKGGAPGAFGAQALAGAVALKSKAPDRTGGSFTGTVGRYDSLGGRGALAFKGDSGHVRLWGGVDHSDGFFLVPEDQRGPVDVPAAQTVRHAGGRGVLALSDTWTLEASLRWYEEERVNGLSLARNDTRGVDSQIRLLGRFPDGPDAEVNVFFRDRTFVNTFASARDERTTERAVLDQFDLPGWGAGGMVRLQWDGLELGLDARRLSGETNERFRNLGQGFTRQRTAGGDQLILGGFAEASGTRGPVAWAATGRIDRYEVFSGSRVERNTVSGESLQDTSFADQSGWVASGRLGADVNLSGAIKVNAALFRSWRLPTINEFYRPFRVVNDITEANARLIPEKATGLEAGVRYRPLSSVSLGVTVFRSWLFDGVGNVTLGFGPGVFDPGGFVPPGGVLRQRANIAESVTDGLEVDLEVSRRMGAGVTAALTARYSLSDARITEAPANPALVGQRPPQTPVHRGQARLAFEGGAWSAAVRVDASAGQFDDDLGTRRLPGFVALGLDGSLDVGRGVSVFARIDNLFGERVISAISSDGLLTLARRPRWQLGVRTRF
ncbi:TonB-dependent receptor [Yunchengibacter salinarum]|uniref:TonB-dependent receptor n=1 Tax=Yunchengibacter salinarum TaxID=3133399 RepID=UPI0035B5F26D